VSGGRAWLWIARVVSSRGTLRRLRFMSFTVS
jgi:hypothetical protein